MWFPFLLILPTEEFSQRQDYVLQPDPNSDTEKCLCLSRPFLFFFGYIQIPYLTVWDQEWK